MSIYQRIFWILLTAWLLVFLLSMILVGYSVPWTGFGVSVVSDNPGEDYQRSKTLWDWMNLLLIPFALFLGGFLLNRSERARERELAKKQRQQDREIVEQRTQELALDTYLKQMSDLLVEKELKTEPTEAVKDVARTWTLTALRRMDGSRKGTITQFLKEAGLISVSREDSYAYSDVMDENVIASPIVSLEGANLAGANLRWAYLEGAILSNADLSGANLSNAYLRGATLHEANLSEANLSGAILHKANLSEANLSGAILHEANLSEADLFGANLKGTNLFRANLEGAQYTPTTIWPDDFDPELKGLYLYVVVDE